MVEHVVVRGAEVSAAVYALDRTANGTPVGAEGDFAAPATRTACKLPPKALD